jgi:hypothetical protein
LQRTPSRLRARARERRKHGLVCKSCCSESGTVHPQQCTHPDCAHSTSWSGDVNAVHDLADSLNMNSPRADCPTCCSSGLKQIHASSQTFALLVTSQSSSSPQVVFSQSSTNSPSVSRLEPKVIYHAHNESNPN